MDSLGCCVIWLLAGVLLGWLLNYWLCKRCCKKSKETTPPPIAKAADVPTTTVAPVAPVEKLSTPARVTPKKATSKASTAKSKAVVASASIIDLAAAKAAGITIKGADDLTVIEGIGPKISELFKDNGLKSLTDVSNATASQMRAILNKGGSRYRMANPGTWTKQAKLAANNKWTELKKLQNELSGGKKK